MTEQERSNKITEPRLLEQRSKFMRWVELIESAYVIFGIRAGKRGLAVEQ